MSSNQVSVCCNSITTTTEQTQEFFKAQQNVTLMLARRGYVVSPKPWHTDWKMFEELWTTSANFHAFTLRGEKEDDVVVVFFPFEEKLRINSIREIIEVCKEKKYYHFIIVYSGLITSFAKQQLVILRTSSEVALRIETFNIRAFQYDPMLHLNVPEQRLLSKEDAQHMLTKFKIKKSQLPKVYNTDPIAQYLGARVHDVVEIIRPSPEGYFYRAWRVCIKGNILK